jgi:hypothetical protein
VATVVAAAVVIGVVALVVSRSSGSSWVLVDLPTSPTAYQSVSCAGSLTCIAQSPATTAWTTGASSWTSDGNVIPIGGACGSAWCAEIQTDGTLSVGAGKVEASTRLAIPSRFTTAGTTTMLVAADASCFSGAEPSAQTCVMLVEQGVFNITPTGSPNGTDFLTYVFRVTYDPATHVITAPLVATIHPTTPDPTATSPSLVSCATDCVATNDSTSWRSTDLGSTWQVSGQVVTPSAYGVLQEVSCASTTCFAYDFNGLLHISTDSGSTWAAHVVVIGGHQVLINSVSCVSASTCFASYDSTVAGRRSTLHSGVIKTKDTGATWSDLNIASSSHVVGVSCASASTCVAVRATRAVGAAEVLH